MESRVFEISSTLYTALRYHHMKTNRFYSGLSQVPWYRFQTPSFQQPRLTHRRSPVPHTHDNSFNNGQHPHTLRHSLPQAPKMVRQNQPFPTPITHRHPLRSLPNPALTPHPARLALHAVPLAGQHLLAVRTTLHPAHIAQRVRTPLHRALAASRR